MTRSWILIFALLLAFVASAGAQQSEANYVDLSVQVTTDNTVNYVNGQAVYRFIFTNNGPATAYNFSADVVGTNRFFWPVASITTTNPKVDTSYRPGRDVGFLLDSLAPGQSFEAVVTMDVPVEYKVTAYVNVQSSNRDIDYRNNFVECPVLYGIPPTKGLLEISATRSVVPAGGAPVPMEDMYLVENWYSTVYADDQVMLESRVVNIGPATVTNALHTFRVDDGGGYPPENLADPVRMEYEVRAGEVGAIQQISPNEFSIASIPPGAEIIFRAYYALAPGDHQLISSVEGENDAISGYPYKETYNFVRVQSISRPPGVDVKVSIEPTGLVNENPSFVAAVTNNGPTTAYNVTFLVKPGPTYYRINYLNAMSSAGEVKYFLNVAQDSIHVIIPELAPGQVETLYAEVQWQGLPSIEMTAQASSDNTRSADINLGNNSALITLAAPACELDIAAEIQHYRVKAKQKKKTGEWTYKLQARVQLENRGLENFPVTTVKAYLSDNKLLDASDILVSEETIKSLKAGKRKRLGMKLKLTDISPIGRYFIIHADGDNTVMECNEGNNLSVMH